MPRFDLYRNPNPRVTHGLLLDVQSDLVRTSTRWCVPLLPLDGTAPLLTGAQCLVDAAGQPWVLDTPNILAVPAALLRAPVQSLGADDRTKVESALGFMLRGY